MKKWEQRRRRTPPGGGATEAVAGRRTGKTLRFGGSQSSAGAAEQRSAETVQRIFLGWCRWVVPVIGGWRGESQECPPPVVQSALRYSRAAHRWGGAPLFWCAITATVVVCLVRLWAPSH